MSWLHGVLLVFHLIGWAMVLGGVLAHIREPKLSPGTWHGILTALVTGLLLVGVNEMGDDPVDHVKIAVKLIVALVVAVAIWRGRKQESVTAGYLGGIAGLTVINIAVAVLWR